MKKISKILGLVLSLLSGCSSTLQPISSDKPEVSYQSEAAKLLSSLPPPKEPIPVAIYKFRDQTGQYKGGDVIQYSTAVTQGGTSILIKALQEAGEGRWFTVIEREGISDLMNERKIIQQMREKYGADNQQLPILPPLLYAGIILQGGIIAYETNLLTGGLGASYFGIGADTQFRRDTVTSMLRAVSVKNGQVLTSVDARKSILSMQLDSGLFRFVGFKRLLGAEAGITSNEPPQIAVMQSIEMCVFSLIMEGILNNLWSFQDPQAAKQIINEYLKEKNSESVVEIDAKGTLKTVRTEN